MCAQNHTIAVDYFALGVFAFELMYGFRPYTGKSRSEIKEKILARQVQVKRNEIPDGWSLEAADFINRVNNSKYDFLISIYFYQLLFYFKILYFHFICSLISLFKENLKTD